MVEFSGIYMRKLLNHLLCDLKGFGTFSAVNVEDSNVSVSWDTAAKWALRRAKKGQDDTVDVSVLDGGDIIIEDWYQLMFASVKITFKTETSWEHHSC